MAISKRIFIIGSFTSLVSSCLSKPYPGHVELVDDKNTIKLYIPVEFLSKTGNIKNSSSVWVDVFYPEMSPTSKLTESKYRIPILISNISNRKTRAEYIYESEKINLMGDIFQMPGEEILYRKSISKKNDDGDSVEYIFKVTSNDYILCYEKVSGLKVVVYRRHSEFLELRYVVNPALWVCRQNIDNAIVQLIDSFIKR